MVRMLHMTSPPANRRGRLTLSASSPMGIRAAAYSNCNKPSLRRSTSGRTCNIHRFDEDMRCATVGDRAIKRKMDIIGGNLHARMCNMCQTCTSNASEKL